MGENTTELLCELADILQFKDKINSIDKDISKMYRRKLIKLKNL